ncbi:ZmpA/ZmpB/ZmpC family metallo-endopeptidase [uncultured Clostridium sp.]|uniref:ZmpA/ZmpB/ZmpC family metallo-endopeptidase n=1 Tax=uncultured Clostridium sp. TaxID=59620 RepID=UPI0025EEAD0F|nr:ZmpA/ZmpB/ZmpC family metallo-endopeptidase [uncultured Clostridium sp.]
MKKLLQKKNEKRVIKYALRKTTMGLVSVVLSVSLVSPVVVSAASAVQSPQEVSNERNIDGDPSLEPIEDTKISTVSIDSLITSEEADRIINEVIDTLNNIKYEDLYDVLNPHERYIDRVQIIAKLKKELGREPSEEEVTKAMKTLYMNRLDLETSFEKVKVNLRTDLKKIITNSTYANKDYILRNKNKVLLALTYLEKQYSFTFGNESAKDLILYNAGLRGPRYNALDNVIGIGNLTYADLELKNNINTYIKQIKPITDEENILDFIEKAVKKYTSEKSAADWFKKTSKAWIVEGDNKYGETSIYNKMSRDERLKSHLIPLLSVSDKSIYAISTMSTVTYGLVDTYFENKDNITMEDLRGDLEKTAKKQEAFIDFWYRISKVNNKFSEIRNIIVIDSLLNYGKADIMEKLWSEETGSKALLGVREFITPLGFYSQYMMADGQAGTDDCINLFLSKSLSDRGQETYTHEVTHLLDNKVWLNGYGRRVGKGAETFARGLFETINNNGGSLITEPIFNLNLSYELGDERIQNKSPERFKTEDDMQQYMKGLMDVIYTLDYVEAVSSLKQSAEDKAILYNQITLTQDSKKNGIVNDTFKNISKETAERLNTIDDLIDNNIVSGRTKVNGILTTGTVTDNGYYVVPLFNPIYAAMQNNSGAVGEITFKRNAYEILAQYGYSNGMVAYISDQYKNDEEALNKILNEYNGNLASFKKDMFAIRKNKISKLKKTDIFSDYKELQEKMDVAVEADLATMKINKKYNINDINQGVNKVERLKKEILQYYLKSTDDFRSSIYKDVVIGEKKEVTENKISPTTISKTDDKLWEDETRIEKGIEGIERVTKIWRTEDGVVVGEPKVTIEKVQEMKPTIIYKGTKKIEGEIVTVDDNVKIPVKVIEKEDKNLYIGETRTEKGQEGIKKVTTIQKTEKGNPVGDPIVKEEIIKEMKPTVIYKGTKKKPEVTLSQSTFVYDENTEDIESLILNSIELEDDSLYMSRQIIGRVPKTPGKHTITVRLLRRDGVTCDVNVDITIVNNSITTPEISKPNSNKSNKSNDNIVDKDKDKVSNTIVNTVGKKSIVNTVVKSENKVVTNKNIASESANIASDEDVDKVEVKESINDSKNNNNKNSSEEINVSEDKKSNNILMYTGLGLVILLIVGSLIKIFKKNSNK